MMERNQEKRLRESLYKVFNALERNDIDKLVVYIGIHKLDGTFYLFLNSPDKKRRESQLEESIKEDLRKLRRIGIVDYIPDTKVVFSGSKRNRIKPGVQDYFWVFTPEKLNLEPLIDSYEYIDPIQPLLDELDEAAISDPLSALRIKMIKGMISGLGDLTTGQHEKIKTLATTVYTMALKGGEVEPSELIPYFKAGLEKIGINP